MTFACSSMYPKSFVSRSRGAVGIFCSLVLMGSYLARYDNSIHRVSPPEISIPRPCPPGCRRCRSSGIPIATASRYTHRPSFGGPMSFVDILLGKPLATSDERAEQIGPVAGIPIFGLDALSSAAYGPEAALTLLIPLGAAGVAYIVPVSASIIVLLAIVYFSYRQTIAAYPGGGGSYTVARENLGASAGLLAAAALMIDYVLTVAVGISAGVGALVSAFPVLLPHTLELCLGILFLIALIN